MPPHLPTTFLHELSSPRTGIFGTMSSSGTAVALAFGADSRLLAVGGDQDAVELWDAQEARQIAALNGHRTSKLLRTVWSLAFSPDGLVLASGGNDKTVRLWNAGNGECINVLTGFSGAVQRLAFHPRARVLAAADEDAVRLFDLGSGAITPVTLTEGGINGLAFSPDGSLLAVATGGKSTRGAHPVVLVDPSSGQTSRTLGGDGSPARSIAFSPDGRLLAAVARGGADVQLWDTAAWQVTRTLKVPSINFAYEVAFSSQGALGAAIGSKVCMWDPAAEDKPATVKLPYTRAEVETLAFSPDGQLLATCRKGTRVRIYR
jgi:WD40 repeat protein